MTISNKYKYGAGGVLVMVVALGADYDMAATPGLARRDTLDASKRRFPPSRE